MIILHGSEGAWAGWSHAQAILFAAHGFLAVPFGYSKGGNFWNAGNIIDVVLDDTAAVLAALRRSAICGPKVGLFGASRGAEHALLVTALMVKHGVDGIPDAVAAHAPADVICGAFDAAQFRDRGDPGWRVWDPGERAWTWRGTAWSALGAVSNVNVTWVGSTGGEKWLPRWDSRRRQMMSSARAVRTKPGWAAAMTAMKS